jgi:hypothetical protein
MTTTTMMKNDNNDGGLCDILCLADQVSTSLTSLSGGITSRRRRRTMDLGQYSTADLRIAVAPMIRALEGLDAASMLSVTPATAADKHAILDPTQNLYVSPIHDQITPPPSDRHRKRPNVVRYLHIKEVPDKYTIGIFVFPPNVQMPLHDHPNMIVLSRVLYGELNVTSYDVIETKNDDNDNDNEKVLRNDANSASIIDRMKGYLFGAKGGGVNVLRVRPNLNPMGVNDDVDKPFVITAPNVTCLYPHEGNCHAFQAGPNGAAILDVLFPPYDDEDDRDCTYYKSPSISYNDHNDHDSKRRRPIVTLTPIDQPNDFSCLEGSYGRFGQYATK